MRIINLILSTQVSLALAAAGCKPAVEIDPSLIAEYKYLKDNCKEGTDVEKVTTIAFGEYVVTRFDPDACTSVDDDRRQKKEKSASLMLADGKPAPKGLAVLISGNGNGGARTEPRVGRNMDLASSTYQNIGYDVIRVENPSDRRQVEEAIRKRYPNGYDGPVETVVHGHGSVNPKTGLHEIAVSETGPDGKPRTVSVPTVEFLQGGVVPGTGQRTGIISSCQGGAVCRNVAENPTLNQAYGNVISSSGENQLSSDLPPQQNGQTTEAGLGNYLLFKTKPLQFDANGDGQVTGQEFAQSAYTPGSTSYEPSALLRPTRRPNEFIQIDERTSDLDRDQTGAPNILTPGPRGTVVENRQFHYNQDMQVLRGDNVLFDQRTAPEGSPGAMAPTTVPQRSPAPTQASPAPVAPVAPAAPAPAQAPAQDFSSGDL